jgi:hypothetical protein
MNFLCLLAQGSREDRIAYLAGKIVGSVIGFVLGVVTVRKLLRPKGGKPPEPKGAEAFDLAPLSEASPPLQAGRLGTAEADFGTEGVALFGDQRFAVANESGSPVKKGQMVAIRDISADGRVVVEPKPRRNV